MASLPNAFALDCRIDSATTPSVACPLINSIHSCCISSSLPTSARNCNNVSSYTHRVPQPPSTSCIRDSICPASAFSLRTHSTSALQVSFVRKKQVIMDDYGLCHPHGILRVRAGADDTEPVAATRRTTGEHTHLRYAPEMMEQLRIQMNVATMREDYKEAARIQETIKRLLDNEPALQLNLLIEKAVAEERYEDAANYRDRLRRLAPTSNSYEKILNCYSDTTTQGVRVQVRSVYVSGRSQPGRDQYFFAYRIRISNECNRSVQLLSRHWVITDANGRAEHARGMGVIGEQPVMLPGTSFEYTSACPLGTPIGKMEGDFEMHYIDESTILTFNVRVGPFLLSMNGDE